MISARWLGDDVQTIDSRTQEYLLRSGRPVDDDAVDPFMSPKAKVQPPVVLARESRTAVDNPPLPEISRLEHYLGADCAAIAARADELECDPVVGAVGIVAIQNGRLVLVCDNHIHRAAIQEVGERNRTTVIRIRYTDALRHINPPGDAAIDVHTCPLVAGQARIPERRPGRCVLEEAAVGAGDLRHRVPITPV